MWRHSMRMRSAVAFAIAVVPVVTVGQQFLPAPPGAPVDPNTRYEVVAIRAGGGDAGVTMRYTPGHFESTNMPLGLLLRQALQKSDYQIVSLPRWVDTERYSIRAT